METTDTQKVTYAFYALIGEAKQWWKGVRGLLESARTPITWETFQNAFLEKYFPANVKDAKELEFMKLEQGSMSVDAYVAKFDELCRFSAYYKLNPDERLKCTKFEGGLRPELLRAIGPI